MKDIPNAESNPAPPTNNNNNKKSSLTPTKSKNHQSEHSDYENERVVNEMNKQNTQESSDENKNIITASVTSEFNNRMDSSMTSSQTSEGDSSDMQQHLQQQAALPEWVVVGESVLIRPYNTSGVISFIGSTHFQVNNFFFFLNTKFGTTFDTIFSYCRVAYGLE